MTRLRPGTLRRTRPSRCNGTFVSFAALAAVSCVVFPGCGGGGGHGALPGAGSGALGSSDGAALSATFGVDTGIASDNSGRLFVVDSTNKVRQISGGFVSTLAGSGTAGDMDGAGVAARFNNPYGIAFNPSDA